MQRDSKNYNMRYAIYKACLDYDYLECLKCANSLVDKLNTEESNDNSSYWYAYYYKAISNNKLENYEEAYENIKLSLDYIEGYSEEKYCLSLTMLAVIKENLGNERESKKLYFDLSRYFRVKGYINLRIFCLFHLAYIRKDLDKLYKLANITSSIGDNSKNSIEIDKSSLLDAMHEMIDKLEI